MKRQTGQWVQKAEEDRDGARGLAKRAPPLRDLACFHCQQSAEKYLKAMLQELGTQFPKTHKLEDLLDLLVVKVAPLKSLRRSLASLSQYAVEYRYPGERATSRQMNAELRHADRVRGEVRTRLGLTQ